MTRAPPSVNISPVRLADYVYQSAPTCPPASRCNPLSGDLEGGSLIKIDGKQNIKRTYPVNESVSGMQRDICYWVQ